MDARFYFEHDGLFLIPIEALSAQGLEPSFAEQLIARGLAHTAWIAQWNQAYALYWQRARELSQRAGRYWLPPAVQNICVALDPRGVRPYFQPLGRSSWLVEQADFDPQTSSLEYSTYRLFQVARESFMRQIVPAYVHNLGYWLLRTRAEIEEFKAGCRRARDAERNPQRALAQALDWVPRLHHESLRPLEASSSASCIAIPGTGLLLPRHLQSDLESLQRKCSLAAESRVQAYYAAHAEAAAESLDELLDWLATAAPALLITGKAGVLLWDPEKPREVEGLRSALVGVTKASAQSMQRDFEVVGARNQSFLDSLRDPALLPEPGAQIDQNGLSYIHKERRLVAYNVHEPGMQRLREPTPAFERWMLGARTIHEWGHLAVDAGWIPLVPEKRLAYAEAQARLAQLLEAIVAEAPAALRALAAQELARLSRQSGGLGQALVAIPLERMSDWQSNLLAQRYLPQVEAETYVRNNSRSLLYELQPSQLFQALTRYAFEYQYLAFSAVPERERYFLSSTWFAEQFFERGLLREERWRELVAEVAELCNCHAIDESKFHFPAR